LAGEFADEDEEDGDDGDADDPRLGQPTLGEHLAGKTKRSAKSSAMEATEEQTIGSVEGDDPDAFIVEEKPTSAVDAVFDLGDDTVADVFPDDDELKQDCGACVGFHHPRVARALCELACYLRKAAELGVHRPLITVVEAKRFYGYAYHNTGFEKPSILNDPERGTAFARLGDLTLRKLEQRPPKEPRDPKPPVDPKNAGGKSTGRKSKRG
jgi:hypothetical protein